VPTTTTAHEPDRRSIACEMSVLNMELYSRVPKWDSVREAVKRLNQELNGD